MENVETAHDTLSAAVSKEKVRRLAKSGGPSPFERLVVAEAAAQVIMNPAWLPKQYTRRNGSAIAVLNSHGTLPDDGRRFGGQTFWRTAAMKRDLDAWLRRQAAGRTMITKDMPPLVLSRVLAAQAKRSRKAMVLKARGHL
jgi:hypothetical protein